MPVNDYNEIWNEQRASLELTTFGFEVHGHNHYTTGTTECCLTKINEIFILD